ncbi:hypothetical protein HYH02_008049 [Chlamydomonas schloesseri]|uniref:Uncharacterized protein n=1 Tax=Chlamydomonas schloesseri TaxID=2026947 RepID=A0A835WG68_9CHLO|nr:hypothetical protein HYH02_008049 [Chlamydomonas schloesseri]|eukprot:KAG2446893.1 hypothetical protein HYH02_008049 [Chlamydomonas schloesseri]
MATMRSCVSGSQRVGVASSRNASLFVGRTASRPSSLTIRAAYDVEVEPVPPRAPNNAPRFGGSGPPPPPPPPPQPTQRGFQPPSRRELLFGALGLGLGIAGTTAYDNRPLDPEEVDERLTSILDELLDDEALLNVLGEEIMLNKGLADQADAVSALEGLKQVDDALGDLIREAEARKK